MAVSFGCVFGAGAGADVGGVRLADRGAAALATAGADTRRRCPTVRRFGFWRWFQLITSLGVTPKRWLMIVMLSPRRTL